MDSADIPPFPEPLQERADRKVVMGDRVTHFHDNKVVYSKLSSFRLTRSRVLENSFTGSTVKDVILSDSALLGNSLNGASMKELRLEGSQLRGSGVHGSKVAHVDARGGSTLAGLRISGSRVSED